jgi:hemophore-related protein
MVKSLRATVVAALGGGIAVSALALSAGVASAQPDLSPVVNTTCSYGQVMAALNDQRPDLAQQFNTSPTAQSMVRGFLSSPPAQRQRTVNSLQGSPLAQAYLDPIVQIAGSCNNY